MCGIVGGINYSLQTLFKGLQLMEHRGPDDYGLEEVAPGLIFGHRRLSIVDLSRNGRQPMQTEDGLVSITFNGEIYNFPELKKELASRYPFRSTTDTEVLLYGYAEWGMEGLLRRAQGMFAFALYDHRTETLYLARDRFGKKPLFYAKDNGRLLFSSTLPSLLGCLGRVPEINPHALDDYLTYMCVPGEKTIFQDVHKLPPASYLTYKNGTQNIRSYWNLSFASKVSMSEEEVLDELDRLMRTAVRRRMISDVPLGAFLSGGVDSSLVVGVMASLSDKPVKTITMGFNESQFDERAHARVVSERWGTVHHEEVIQPQTSAILPELIFHAGEPLADSSMLPTYYVAKLARKHLTVVLNGDGGDELFAGYARPMVERLAAPYRSFVPAPIRRQLHALLEGGGKPRLRSLSAIKQVIGAGARSARESFVFDRALRSSRSELYTAEFRSQLAGYHPDQVYQAVWDRADAKDNVDQAMYGDLMTYLPDELLVKMDTMTMANSLEARSPLLDTELAEFSAQIPSALKTKNLQTKYLLKKLSERYVPREVLYRPKKGFNMPMSDWVRGELNSLVRETLLSERASRRGYFNRAVIRRWLEEHERGAADHGQKLWSLFILELWFLMFVDGKLKRSDALISEKPLLV
ncbi:asparagine synthase (glutamine-hydrolyzing) [Paenibacillus silviterrae]|uniref:asparagine synthase (glutamine-hydrolyzing) n=1 Tax=Paenibacillus silviterrae TaxID=3242194 RepID=UPI002543AE09|nr:asparagine synthase (glutamine-hydrolyzing) [Paenibacillus chinjuensis]